MNTNAPYVTILIASHNYGDFVGKAIESALAQNYPNFGICIVDSSDDNSWPVIHDTLFKKNPHNKEEHGDVVVKTAKVDNHPVLAIKLPQAVGPSETRNIGIAKTMPFTDIYAILDADDEMYPHKLSVMVSIMMQSPDTIGVVYGDYDVLNTTTGNLVREFKEPYDKFRLMQECIVHSGSIVSKLALQTVVEETGWYDRTMRTCEDYDLWMRISDHFIIMHVAEPLTLVRVTPKNSTDSVAKQIWEQNWHRVMMKSQVRRNVCSNKQQICCPN